MPLALSRKTSLPLAILLIFVTGVIAGYWRFDQTRRSLLANLVETAVRCAMAFDPAELSPLSGAPEDAGKPEYTAIKQRLLRLRQVKSDIRSIYLVRSDSTSGATILLVDSEPPTSRRTPAAVVVHDAANQPALQAVLQSGKPSAEGPLHDPSGTWVTGYAHIVQPENQSTQVILGIEIGAEHWKRTLWSAAMGTAAYVWMFLLFPLAVMVSTRRQNRQRDTLRNLTEAMEQAQSAVMIVTPKQRIEYTNAGFCRQLGYSRDELIGREWRDFQAFEAPADVIHDLVETVGKGQPWSGEWTMRRKDGGLFPVRGGVTPVKDKGGVIRSFVAVFDDVTEIRQTESALREAKERAEAGDKAKGQFLATMSHEVRTPLNGIVGFASLLLDTDLTPEQQEFVATIRTSSETLIQLTGDILDYARIESGRLKLEPQPCDPRECVENSLDLMASTAAEKGIELLHWIDDSVPAAIMVDVSRLRQVLVNLVNNAVKFTASGEVEVRVRALSVEKAEPPAEPNVRLEFSVRDTGIGIAPRHHTKIFKPFTQVDESTTRRFGGTGLGLAVCKNIVELMNGSISFESELGRGAKFIFTIRVPVHSADGLALPARPLEHPRLAVVAEHPGLREELVQLGRRQKGDVFTATLEELAARTDWETAVIDITERIAVDFAARTSLTPSLPPKKLIGLVSIAWPPELRTALRTHFRVLLNKPPHHDALRSQLSTRSSLAPFPPPAEPAIPAKFGLEVLIVEDNPVNQQLVQRVVSNLGCRWTSAPNGRVAVEQLLGGARPNIVLMDLHMPEMDGLTATKKIRAGEAGAESQAVWIIVLTADARLEQRERTLSAGANDYLTKPVRLQELMSAFERYLRTVRPRA